MVLEEDAKAESELSTESVKNKLWNGSRRNMMVLSITEMIMKLTMSGYIVIFIWININFMSYVKIFSIIYEYLFSIKNLYTLSYINWIYR